MSGLKRDDGNVFYFNSEHDTRMGYYGCERHYHSLFEIYYMTEGSCSYFIDDKLYAIEKGDIVLIPGGVIHKSNYIDESYSRLLINCSKYFIPTEVLKLIPEIIYVYHNEDIEKDLGRIFSDIAKEYNYPDKFSDDSLRSLMHSLFILLARNPNHKSQVAKKNIYTEKAIEYIRNNYSLPVTLNAVSKICAVSPEHMSRIFKKETGFGFNEYLTYIRLQNAEYLLKNQNLSVTEVAHRCGFSDSNYFSYIFKKNYGLTPVEMKKKVRL